MLLQSTNKGFTSPKKKKKGFTSPEFDRSNY